MNSMKRKNPIKRNNLFFGEDGFQADLEFGLEYVENDINQSVILYEVDLENTNTNSIYYESKKDSIRFKTPIEVNVIYNLGDPTLGSYDKTKIMANYVKIGKLEFFVYEKSLLDINRDIKRGDYIGLQVNPDKIVYFVVNDDGRVNYDNEHTMYGYKPFYRSIKTNMVDVNEFNGE